MRCHFPKLLRNQIPILKYGNECIPRRPSENLRTEHFCVFILGNMLKIHEHICHRKIFLMEILFQE